MMIVLSAILCFFLGLATGIAHERDNWKYYYSHRVRYDIFSPELAKKAAEEARKEKDKDGN